MDNQNFLYLSFIIDTNRINARQNNSDLNLLERWADKGLIEYITTETVLSELKGYVPGYNKGRKMNFSRECNLTPEEQQKKEEIGDILFGKIQLNANQKNDITIVFNARKYCCYLITNDGGSKSQPGGILGNRKQLSKQGVVVLTEGEAVQFVQQRISDGRKWIKREYNLDDEAFKLIIEVIQLYKKTKDEILLIWRKIKLYDALEKFRHNYVRFGMDSLERALSDRDELTKVQGYIENLKKQAKEIDDTNFEKTIEKFLLF